MSALQIMGMPGNRHDHDDAQRHSGMGLQQTKTKPRGDDEMVSASNRHGGKQASGPTPEAAPTRPKKMIVLHWLTVLCLVMAAALILTRDQVDGRALEQWLLEGHRHFGLLVLLLLLARVVVRLRAGKLPPAGEHSPIIRVAAALTHIALYGLLLALPLLGWALSDAEDKPVHFLGATLPAIVGADEDLADRLQMLHTDAAWLLLGLVTLHVAAALVHHFVLRDGTLRMMLPKRRR
jgi:cytochrome b561